MIRFRTGNSGIRPKIRNVILGAALTMMLFSWLSGSLAPAETSTTNKLGKTPFGFHSSITLPPNLSGPEENASGMGNPPRGYDYAQQTYVGWERTLVYARDPAKIQGDWRKAMDRVILDVPPAINIIVTIDVRSFCYTQKPQLSRQESRITVYVPEITSLQLITEAKYLFYLKELVGRYKTRVKYWQIDNELPGIPSAGPDFTPLDNTAAVKAWLDTCIANYSHIMEVSSKTIKEVDPDAKVVMAGIMDMGPGTVKLFDAFYLPVLKKVPVKHANGKTVIDYFDFHHYGDAQKAWRIMKAAHDYFRNGINAAGHNHLKILCTETGTYTGQPLAENAKPAPLQTEKQQAKDLVRRMIYPLTYGVKVVLWAPGIFDFPSQGKDGAMGLIYDGKPESEPPYGTAKLAFFTFKKMSEIFCDVDLSNVLAIQENNGLYVFRFNKLQSHIWVVWNENPGSTPVRITDVAANFVRVTEAVPPYPNGKDIPDYHRAFHVKIDSVRKRSVTITVSDSPVFVEEITVD